jgi:hypothetical protein
MVDDVPVRLLDSTERLTKMVGSTDEKEIIAYLMEGKHLKVIVDTLCTLFLSKGNKAFSPYLAWDKTQRLFFVWHALASASPIGKLKETFRNFRSPEKWEKKVAEIVDLLKKPQATFKNVLYSWMIPLNDGYDYRILRINNDEIELVSFKKDVTVFKFSIANQAKMVESAEGVDALMAIWRCMKQMMDGWGGFWKGRKSTCYSLHEVDYDVIRALKDPTRKLVETLNQTQLAGKTHQFYFFLFLISSFFFFFCLLFVQ